MTCKFYFMKELSFRGSSSLASYVIVSANVFQMQTLFYRDIVYDFRTEIHATVSLIKN